MKTKHSTRIIVKTRNFLKRHLKSCPKWQKKLLPEICKGILISGSLQLSKISRAIKKKKDNIQVIENRLSRNMKSRQWDIDKIAGSYYESTKKYIKRNTPINIDRGDYAKPYARKLQHCKKVWDGSKKEKVTGYWSFSSVSGIGEGEILPLVNFPYYIGEDEKNEKGEAQKWGFKSENEAMEYGYNMLYELYDGKGIWIEDRGADRIQGIRYKAERKVRFITRLTDRRGLLSADNKGIGRVVDVVRNAKLENSIYYTSAEGEPKKRLSLGSKKIRIPQLEGEYNIVILRDDEKLKECRGKEALIEDTENEQIKKDEWYVCVITNLNVENFMDEERIMRLFFNRWSIEDSFRFVKQEFGAEYFLVRDFRAIRRLTILVYIITGLIFLITQMCPSTIKYLENISDCFEKEAKLYYYRIVWGLRKLLSSIRSP